MIFGREPRRVKADIPAGTFVVDFDEPDPRAPREIKWVKGLVVEADSHLEAVERANGYIERMNTVRRIASRVRR